MTFGYYLQTGQTASSRAAPPNPQRGAGAQQLGQVLQALRQAATAQTAATAQAAAAASTTPPPTVQPGGGSSFRGGVQQAATGALGLLGGFGALAAAAIAAAKRLGTMADNTLAVNQVLGDYNALIAGANALAEARGMIRAIEVGQTIGPSYSRLSEARSDFADMRARIGAPLASAGQTALAGIQESLNSMLKAWEPALITIAETIEWIAKEIFKMKPVEKTELVAEGMLRDFADGKFDGRGLSPFLRPPGTPLGFGPGQRSQLFGSTTNPLKQNWP